VDCGAQARLHRQALAREFAVRCLGVKKLIEARPEVVIEALRTARAEHAEALLSNGVAVIVLSAGAVRRRAASAPRARRGETRGLLYLPSGGFGASTRSRPRARGRGRSEHRRHQAAGSLESIAYVEKLKIDLDGSPAR